MQDRCTRCVTPATWAGIRFDKNGVCSLCSAFERRWSKWLSSKEIQAKSRSKLDRLVQQAKANRQGKYDLMVPISGGKDSLYVLYWLKTHYDLSILTYTYDNGLFDAGAMENIRIAKERLGVDHVMDTLPFQQELLRHFLNRTGNFCGACVIPYLIGSHRCARENKVKLIVFGLSKRTDANGPDGMNPFFSLNVVDDGFGQARFRKLWGKHPILDYARDSSFGGLRVINLPDFIPWDEVAMSKELEENLGVHLGPEHFDCVGHDVANWLTTRRYGFGTSVMKLSQKIRCGLLTRDEALARLDLEKDEVPASMDQAAKRLGVTPAQIELASHRSMTPYFRGVGNFLAVWHRNIFLGRY